MKRATNSTTTKGHVVRCFTDPPPVETAGLAASRWREPAVASRGPGAARSVGGGTSAPMREVWLADPIGFFRTVACPFAAATISPGSLVSVAS
jgi:hypothetical protein